MHAKGFPLRPLFRPQPLAAALASMLALAEPGYAGEFGALKTGPNPGRASIAPDAGGRPASKPVTTLSTHASQIASSTVTSCDDDGGSDTLRYAIAMAGGGILDLSGLACGKITLNVALEVYVDDLTIQGPVDHTLTLDGNAADRVFLHTGHGTLSLKDLTVTNGKVSADNAQGGCIRSVGNVSLTHTTVTSCAAIGQTMADGGGIYAQGDLLLEGSTISNNLADATIGRDPGYAGRGGGTFSRGLTLQQSTISGNTLHIGTGRSYGAGACAYTMTSKYSTISGNKATITIGDNSNYTLAGGLLASKSLFMVSSTVDHNEADVAGALLVANAPSGFVSIIQSTFSANTGNRAIGAMFVLTTLSMANSTIAFNTSGPYGTSAVVADGVTATLQSSIIASNTPLDLGGTATFEGMNNLVRFAGAKVMLPPNTLRVDPMLLPLAYNGGATRTHALGVTSPAINAGNDAASLLIDQRGETYPRVVGMQADIGAVEFDSDHIFGNAFGSP